MIETFPKSTYSLREVSGHVIIVASRDPTEIKNEIEKANQLAVDRMMESDPVWVGIGLARNVIPGMKEKMFLHAGPPIEWNRMSGPMKGAIMGAAIYEGWARDGVEAEKLAKSGQVTFVPNHHYDAVGPMAGVISPNMPVYVVKDRKYGYTDLLKPQRRNRQSPAIRSIFKRGDSTTGLDARCPSYNARLYHQGNSEGEGRRLNEVNYHPSPNHG